MSGNDVVAAPAIISVFVPKVVAQIEARIEGQRLEKVGFDTAHNDKTYYAALKFPCVWRRAPGDGFDAVKHVGLERSVCALACISRRLLTRIYPRQDSPGKRHPT